MIKKIFFIGFLFLSFNSFSQNIDQIRSVADFSSESELVSYVEKAQLKGLNLIQIEKLAVAQGAKPSEIQLLRKLWNSNNNESSIDSNLKESSILVLKGAIEIDDYRSKELGDTMFRMRLKEVNLIEDELSSRINSIIINPENNSEESLAKLTNNLSKVPNEESIVVSPKSETLEI